jgi:hypothetical protein
MGKTADHVFLEAIIEWRKKGNKDQSNADFLMELAKEYLVHCGSKPIP